MAVTKILSGAVASRLTGGQTRREEFGASGAPENYYINYKEMPWSVSGHAHQNYLIFIPLSLLMAWSAGHREFQGAAIAATKIPSAAVALSLTAGKPAAGNSRF